MNALLVLFAQDECPPYGAQNGAQRKILEGVKRRIDPDGLVGFYASDLTPPDSVKKNHLAGALALAVFEKGRLSELVVGAQKTQCTEMLCSKWVDHYKKKYV